MDTRELYSVLPVDMLMPVSTPPIDQLAQAAIAPIKSGMTVGLGTGRAAARAVRALGERVKRERLAIVCVATSRATEELARSLGMRVVDLNEVTTIDYLFDGADEVDPSMRMIKGGGAAMTREKIVAHATLRSGGRAAFLIDEGKRSPRLGAKRALPIEVIPMARAAIQRELRAMQLSAELRTMPTGEPVVTDNGGQVLDATITESLSHAESLTELDRRLSALAGVIGHGLFLVEAHELLVESADGRVVRQTRVQ